MNDLDELTFARFARRFAHVEQYIPAPPPRAFARALTRRSGVATLVRSALLLAVLLLAAAIGLMAIGSRLAPTVTVPPDSSPPAVVLDAYLRALQAGDCGTADQLVDPLFFGTWNEALCGDITRVTGFAVVDGPVVWRQANEADFTATLSFTGGTHGLSAGEVTFRFTLRQQSSGKWRLVQADEQPVLPIVPPRSSP
jgi:hypothetical protein